MTTDRARMITLAEQRELDRPRQLPANYVPAHAGRVEALPVASAAQHAGELVAGLMTDAKTIHVADPVSRGKAMLLKTSAVTVALGLLTMAAMIMLGEFAFFMWLLWASVEWVGCFVLLAILDWREHPSSIRHKWTGGLLEMMQAEQARRLDAQYGIRPAEVQPQTESRFAWLALALAGLGLAIYMLLQVMEMLV